MRYKIDSENSTRINITGRRTGERPGCVRIFHKGQLSEEAYYKFSGFETFLFIWEKEQEYEGYSQDLELYNTLNGTQNAQKVLQRSDGSAMLIDSTTARLYVPQ